MKVFDLQKRFLLAVMVIALVIVSVMYHLYWKENSAVTVHAAESYEAGNQDQIQYAIEETSYDETDGSYWIKGWCIKPGVTHEYYNYGADVTAGAVYNCMHLGIQYEGQIYLIPTRLEQRDDVDEAVNDGIDYAYCGFRARIPADQLGDYVNGTIVLLWQSPDGTQELYTLDGVSDNA